MKHAITIALLSAFALTGCNSGKRIAKANDNLRIEREQLKEQVTALENENAELHVKIAELLQSTDSELSEDVLAAMPRVASIELTRYCSIWTEGGASEARFFVVPRDGRGRFVHAVGEIGLSVSEFQTMDQLLDSPEAQSSRALAINDIIKGYGTQRLTSHEVRDAYITGLSGSGYMFQLPLNETPNSDVVFTIAFKDAVTGVVHTTERIVSP